MQVKRWPSIPYNHKISGKKLLNLGHYSWFGQCYIFIVSFSLGMNDSFYCCVER